MIQYRSVDSSGAFELSKTLAIEIAEAGEPGKVTGGGTVVNNGVRATFGFTAQGEHGSLTYVEHRAAVNMKLTSVAIQSVTVIGDTAVIAGSATLNGTGGYAFRLTAIDNGEPGHHETFLSPGSRFRRDRRPDLTFAAVTLAGGNTGAQVDSSAERPERISRPLGPGLDWTTELTSAIMAVPAAAGARYVLRGGQPLAPRGQVLERCGVPDSRETRGVLISARQSGTDWLIYVRQAAGGIGTENLTFSMPEINDLKSRVTTMTAFGDFLTVDFTLIGFGREPRVVKAGVVNGSF